MWPRLPNEPRPAATSAPTWPSGPAAMARSPYWRRKHVREQVARDLERARVRTLELTDFDDPELIRQHDPLMSPLVWDLAHIGQQEELWLLRAGNAGVPGLLPPDVEQLYDAFK